MRKIKNALKKFLGHAVAFPVVTLSKSLESYYSNLFKAGISLIGIYLITVSQALPVIVDYEFESLKLTHEFEHSSGMDLNSSECSDINEYQLECKLAKHRASSAVHGRSIANTILTLSFAFGLLLMAMSTLGFLSKAITEYLKGEKGGKA